MDGIRNRVLELSKKRNISLRNISSSIGMSPTGLNRTLKDGSIKVSTLISLSEFFEVPITYFIQDYDLDTQSIKLKKSSVLQLIESGELKLSLEPLMDKVIKEDFTEDFIKRSFKLKDSISFYDLFDNYLSKLVTETTNEIELEESYEFFDDIGYLIYHTLTTKEFVKELSELKLLDIISLSNDVRAYVEKLKEIRTIWKEKILDDDQSMTSN